VNGVSLASLQQKFAEPVDAASLGLFRILWGALISYEASKNLARIPNIYTPEIFHFTYPFFPFVAPWPEEWMMAAEAWLMIACGVLVCAGVAFRYASGLHTLLYAHFFLVEVLFYNNHFYLSILLGFLLTLSRADACYSVSHHLAAKKPTADGVPTVPLWNLITLRGQMCIVYFFGGIAKLNADWIRGEPIRIWMQHTEAPEWFSQILTEPWFVYFISFSGIAIDLTVGFFLLYRRTFWPAALVLSGFHATNSQLFPIGIFPLLGIASLLLFAPPSLPRSAAAWLRRRASGRSVSVPRPAAARSEPVSTGVVAFVLGYLAIQILLPLRIHCYAENPSWTEVGHAFSWRMMLRYKDAHLNVKFEPPEADRTLEDSGRKPPLSPLHFRKMTKSPELIVQWVHALDAALSEIGMPDVEIRVVSVASLNGRPYQLMIDPERDLTEVRLGLFERYDWIVPLRPNQPISQYPKNGEDRRRKIQQAVDTYNLERRQRRALPPSDG
jgi:hypothetical protein